MATASIIVVGREILTGKFRDENGPYLIGRLRKLGIEVRRLVVVDDVVEEIADEVRRCSEGVDHVFTTGGVGPTHDDVTFEGIAAAFDVPLVLDATLREVLARFGLVDAANLRMATIPDGAELFTAGVETYPIVRMRNVYVLPGIPGLVKQKFEALAPTLAGRTVHALRVYARDRESDVAGDLAALDAAHPAVDIGSYPRWGESDHRLIVTAESSDRHALEAARQAIESLVDVVKVTVE